MRVHLLSTAAAPLDPCRALAKQRHTPTRYGATLTGGSRVLVDSTGASP